MINILAAAESASPIDLWSLGADYLKQSPLVFLCVLWILDLRRQNTGLQKRNNDLEALMRSLNDKIRDDIVPLLTRILDLVPELLVQVRRRK